MASVKSSLVFAALLLTGSQAFANNKTLFVNGVNAAVHGDLIIDRGEWRNQESYSALRLKAGFQLIRLSFVGLTIGYQKVGFYTAEKNWTKAGASKTRFDYRGPVAELHLFPGSMFGLSVAGFQGSGYSFTKGESAKDFPITCDALNAECLGTQMERSRLVVKELTAQINYSFRPGLQLFVGAGNRKVTGEPEYLLRPQSGDSWQAFDAPKWKLDTQFFMLGIRGSTL